MPFMGDLTPGHRVFLEKSNIPGFLDGEPADEDDAVLSPEPIAPDVDSDEADTDESGTESDMDHGSEQDADSGRWEFTETNDHFRQEDVDAEEAPAPVSVKNGPGRPSLKGPLSSKKSTIATPGSHPRSRPRISVGAMVKMKKVAAATPAKSLRASTRIKSAPAKPELAATAPAKKRARAADGAGSGPPAKKSKVEDYEVEGILDCQAENDTTLYLVKWKGYSAADNTWEPKANLSGCKELVAAFDAGYNAGFKQGIETKPKGAKTETAAPAARTGTKKSARAAGKPAPVEVAVEPKKGRGRPKKAAIAPKKKGKA